MYVIITESLRKEEKKIVFKQQHRTTHRGGDSPALLYIRPRSKYLCNRLSARRRKSSTSHGEADASGFVGGRHSPDRPPAFVTLSYSAPRPRFALLMMAASASRSFRSSSMYRRSCSVTQYRYRSWCMRGNSSSSIDRSETHTHT